MKIYLASRYSRREELCEYRSQLRAMGHVVTSRWLDGNHQVSDKGLSEQAAEADRTRFAVEDWEDLTAAEVCISFTEEPRTELTRGGRHVEFGGALAMGKLCIVIGHRENVFHCLPGVHYRSTWESFVYHLASGWPEIGAQLEALRADAIKAKELADEVKQLEKDLDEAQSNVVDLKEQLIVYEAAYDEDEPATIDARGVASLPSIDRDQMLADLKREVLAVGGVWP